MISFIIIVAYSMILSYKSYIMNRFDVANCNSRVTLLLLIHVNSLELLERAVVRKRTCLGVHCFGTLENELILLDVYFLILMAFVLIEKYNY